MPSSVLSIGTELTRGELVNSNAAWISEQLTTVGLEVRRQLTIGDDVGEIASAIRELSRVSSLIVATGGLGPTTDDLTAAAVAQALGVELMRDHGVLQELQRRFESRGRTMVASNSKQADFPRGAEILPNATGTAPGFTVVLDGARCFFLPGVPAEMRAMFETEVAPRVRELGRRDGVQVHLRTYGLPESLIQERVAHIEQEIPGVTLRFRAHLPEVEVKVHARALDPIEAEAIAERAAAALQECLGDFVYGGVNDTFAAVVGRELRNRGLTLAVAESCTGGLVGAMLTSVPGSSEYVLLDAVTYANSAKSDVLGVSPDLLRAYGAVSSETAGAMAEGARRVADADLAIAITGIAGPSGGTDEKPVGTVWLGLAARDAPTQTLRHLFHGDRDQVRVRAAYAALDMLRRAVLTPTSQGSGVSITTRQSGMSG